jgi:class 3 adenylate cyclase
MRKWLNLVAFISLFITTQGLAQTGLIDSLKVVLITSDDDSIKVQNLILLSQNLVGTDNQNAIYYASKARNLATELHYEVGRAYALKYIGMGYYFQDKYVDAINYWEESLAVFEEMGDLTGVSNMLNNLGAINQNEGDDTKALEIYLRALTVAEEADNTQRIATALTNIGVVYAKKPETYQKSLDYLLRALPLFEELQSDSDIGNVTVNIGNVYFDLDDDSTALIYYQKSLLAYDGSSDVPYTLISMGRVFAKRGEFNKSLQIQQEALTLARRYESRLVMAKAMVGIGDTYRLMGRYHQAIANYHNVLEINEGNVDAEFKNDIREAYQGLAKAYERVGDYRRAFEYQELLTAIKDTLFYAANQKKLDLLVSNFENEQKQGEIDLLTKEQALQEANLQKEKIQKNAFLGGFVLILIIAFVIFRNYRNKVKTNKLLDKQNEEIEGLLLNILPAEVAHELQHDGYATPKNYESVTVLFTDFQGFTKISSGLLPHELIAELNSYFNEFDDIIEKHNLEKIKTIGDAYMCAGGVPTINTTHPIDAVEAGLAMQDYIRRKNEMREADGLEPWQLRVGIHTGPIVAGVVGRKKYAYDIWGDAVNIASRMESNGEACKVNISEATYQLVKEQFTCTFRGKISVKGAGEKRMYFVEGPATGTPGKLSSSNIEARIEN